MRVRFGLTMMATLVLTVSGCVTEAKYDFLHGTVTRAVTAAPLDSAFVWGQDESYPLAVTGTDGAFEFHLTRDIRHDLRVERRGYRPVKFRFPDDVSVDPEVPVIYVKCVELVPE